MNLMEKLSPVIAERKKSKFAHVLLSTFFFAAVALRCQGEESSVGNIWSALSSTTISGYVDTSVSFSNTNASAHGFAGIWIGIITDRNSTNRIELYFIVDEIGNFAGRGMNYDRTLGSEQLEGTLDRDGIAKIG